MSCRLLHFDGRPDFFGLGSSGSSLAHWASVRSNRLVTAMVSTRSPVLTFCLVVERSTGDLAAYRSPTRRQHHQSRSDPGLTSRQALGGFLEVVVYGQHHDRRGWVPPADSAPEFPDRGASGGWRLRSSPAWLSRPARARVRRTGPADTTTLSPTWPPHRPDATRRYDSGCPHSPASCHKAVARGTRNVRIWPPTERYGTCPAYVVGQVHGCAEKSVPHIRSSGE